jgi:hypothetical protein
MGSTHYAASTITKLSKWCSPSSTPSRCGLGCSGPSRRRMPREHEQEPRSAKVLRWCAARLPTNNVGRFHSFSGCEGDRSRELDRGHHSRRPRKRNCDSMMCSSSRARSNPARPLLGLLMWSLSIRRSAAATRSRARSKSATVYCRGPGRVRFPCRPFDALLAGMAALSCFAAAIWPLRLSKRTASIKTYSVRLRERSRGNLGVHGI